MSQILGLEYRPKGTLKSPLLFTRYKPLKQVRFKKINNAVFSRKSSDSVYACYKISTIPQIINSSKFKDDKQFLDEENRMGLFNGELINTERFLMFRIHSNDYGDPLFVYDKYSEKITKVKLTLNNPINIFWNFPIACTKKGECYYAVSASKAINYKDFLYETYDDEQLLNKLYSSLSADSNPIICISSFICKDEK